MTNSCILKYIGIYGSRSLIGRLKVGSKGHLLRRSKKVSTKNSWGEAALLLRLALLMCMCSEHSNHGTGRTADIVRRTIMQ